MTRYLRYSRIALSTICGLAAVLLIIMWARSYGTWDRCFRTGKNHGLQLNSTLGHVVLVVAERPQKFIPFFIAHVPTPERFQAEFDKNVLGFYSERTPSGLILDVPYWFLLLLSIAAAVAPWRRQLRWQFSLRTLLVATTIVAVMLGLIVYFAR
jgi:hypothetical protein